MAAKGPNPSRRDCRVLLVGGGTGGHVSPLLAVAEALRERGSGTRLLFVGGRRGLEAELVRAAGIDFHATPMPSRRDPDSRLSLVVRGLLFPLALVDALVAIARFRPDVCVSSGGLVSLAPVIAARALRVPLYLWIGDAIPGRAHRIVAGWAQRIGATFEPALAYLPRRKTSVSGNPVRRSLLRWSKREARERLVLPEEGLVLLVTGGSQGAAAINDALLAALPRLLRKPSVSVVHLTGPAHLARAEARQAQLADPERARYHPHAYLAEDMGAALAAADLVVARASSSSIAEPLALGVPLVLIPFGAAASGHQLANARAVVERGAAISLAESEADADRVAAVVSGLLDDPARLGRMRESARAAGRPEAAAEIAAEVLRLGGCA